MEVLSENRLGWHTEWCGRWHMVWQVVMHHHMPVLRMQEMQKMLASTQAGKTASKLSEEACAEGEQREEQLKQARLCSERHGTASQHVAH